MNKVGTAFTASQTAASGAGIDIPALNNTLYHWGAIVLPLGYTVSEVYDGGGNPYGASFVTEGGIHGGPDERALTVARAQGQRLTRITGAIARAREQGLLEDRAGVIRDPSARPRPAESGAGGQVMRRRERPPVSAGALMLCEGSRVPWVPELFSAPALARIEERLRLEELTPCPTSPVS